MASLASLTSWFRLWVGAAGVVLGSSAAVAGVVVEGVHMSSSLTSIAESLVGRPLVG